MNGLSDRIQLHKVAVSDAYGEPGSMCVLPAFDGNPDVNQYNGQLQNLTAASENDR